MVSGMMGEGTRVSGAGLEGARPPEIYDISPQLGLGLHALRDVYGLVPKRFLAEGRRHPRLEAWCEQHGRPYAMALEAVQSVLEPLFPEFFGSGRAPRSADWFGALGARLAGQEFSLLEYAMPWVVGQLVRGLPSRDQAGLRPEQQLLAAGERHPAVAALLKAYDREMRDRPSRAKNDEQSMWQRLSRHLLMFRVRRIVGFAVEPLMSQHLRQEAAKLDDPLLRKLGRLVCARNEFVANADELEELTQEARKSLGRESEQPPEDPPDPPSSSLDEAIDEVEQDAQRMGERLGPHGKKVTVIVEDKEPEEPAAVMVRLDRPSPAPPSTEPAEPTESAASELSALPPACENCRHAASLADSLARFRVTLEHGLASLRNRDGPCTVPL